MDLNQSFFTLKTSCRHIYSAATEKKGTYVTTEILAMPVFCLFFAVFAYSFSASPDTSSRTAVIERKTYTFHEPSNKLVFLEINYLLWSPYASGLLLSLRGAYPDYPLLSQEQNIWVYCLAWYILTASRCLFHPLWGRAGTQLLRHGTPTGLYSHS